MQQLPGEPDGCFGIEPLLGPIAQPFLTSVRDCLPVQLGLAQLEDCVSGQGGLVVLVVELHGDATGFDDGMVAIVTVFTRLSINWHKS